MRLATATAAALVMVWAPVWAQKEFTATLAGHVTLPPETFIDAPADLKVSGKYTTGKRIEAIGSVMGKSFEHPTGVSLPFKGQPIQGHSGIKVMPDGTYWIITDNGFGSKANSPESMLYLNRYRIDWAANSWQRAETIFLHDPDKKVPFRVRAREHRQALPDRCRLRHRGLPVDWRDAVDRR